MQILQKAEYELDWLRTVAAIWIFSWEGGGPILREMVFLQP